jgi:pimeloyl-ACP methyl ester carboxylesterase
MRRSTMVALLGSVLFTVSGAPAAGASGAVAAASDVVSISAGFPVRNVNGSGTPCQSDGKPYVVHGEVVGPRSVLTGGAPAAATLYLHEYEFDDFWHFRTVPGVDYAGALGAGGHVSVTIDRLGYDDSPQPDGNAICLGAQADMAHQIVQELRAGTYRPEGVAPRPFQRVVLGGHSVGAIISELEAYSFHDVDALMLFGHTDGDNSMAALATGTRQGAVCARGGDGDGAPNYAFFATAEESRNLGYRDADPAVISAQGALRHPDPCGDVNSLVPVVATNKNRVGEIKVPVLLLYGKNDATLADGAGDRQSAAYTGSKDVSTAYFDDTGHALVLERKAPQVEATVSLFLDKHGFGAPGAGALVPQGAGESGGHARPLVAARAAPLLRLRGVPRRRGCVRRAFRVRVNVLAGGGALQWAHLALDGQRILRTRRRSFSKRVAVQRLAPGPHRLVASAREAAGSRARTQLTFRRCR